MNKMYASIAGAVVTAGVAFAVFYSPSDSPLNIVRLHLTDPDSAKFRNTAVSKKNPSMFCGEVNARNKIGGMVGFTRFVADLPDKSASHYLGSDTGYLTDMSKVYFTDSDGFEAKWSLWCL